MNKKTLEHIENFVDGVKWNIIIKDGQITFDLTLPSADHLPPQKMIDLERNMNGFLASYIGNLYISPAFEEFKGCIVSQETCLMIKSFINSKEAEMINSGWGSIKKNMIMMLVSQSGEENSLYLMRHLVIKHA